MAHATPQDVSSTYTHGRCYTIKCSLNLPTWSMLPHRMFFELKTWSTLRITCSLDQPTHMADATQRCHDSRRFHSGFEEVAGLRSENTNRLLHPKQYFSVLLERSWFTRTTKYLLPGFNVHRWCHASIVKVLYKYALQCPKQSPQAHSPKNTALHS